MLNCVPAVRCTWAQHSSMPTWLWSAGVSWRTPNGVPYTQRQNECACSADLALFRHECACLKRARKFTREKEWEWQYFHSDTIAGIWRHFKNSNCLFILYKPLPEQIRFPLSKKFLSNLLCNISFPTKKLFMAQVWILVSKWSGRNMAMNFVARVIVIALCFIASSVWQTVRRKVMLFERKNTPKLFL